MSSDLCEEWIFEIFTRLPSKSLLRFRSLSKSLCSCIDSPDFIRLHTSRSPQKVLFKHRMDRNKEHPVKYALHSEDQLPLCPTRGYIGITAVEFPYSGSTWCVGSSNGILCMFDANKYIISIWNPSIRRKIMLPTSPTSCCYGCHCEVFRVGFGFDSVTDDNYKIVSLPKYGGTRKRSYVYTMKTGAWCEIASPTPSYGTVTTRGCCINGALHWVVSTKSDKVHYYIMTFNLSTYVFGMIELPEPSWETEHLTTIQGSLSAISSNHNGDLLIWVMREYNNTASWSVFFKSKVNQVKGKVLEVSQRTNNGNLLFDTFCGGGFQVYDAKIATQSRLQNLDDDSFILDMEPCVESLQLLLVSRFQLFISLFLVVLKPLNMTMLKHLI